MATVKVKFRPSTVKGKTGVVYYQIIQARKARQCSTGYRIFPEEWNERRGMPMVSSSGRGDRDSVIEGIRERIRYDLERFCRIVRKLEESGEDYTADIVADDFENFRRLYSLANFAEGRIVTLRQRGRVRTAENYACALRSFRSFLRDAGLRRGDSDDDIILDAISQTTMEEYESWLRGRGVTPNSISCYMRTLRAIYNWAVDAGITEQRNPFRHTYTGIGKTVKRTLTLPQMRLLKGMDLSGCPQLEYARDIFLLSFYLRGMSFIDMAFLEKRDLANGHIIYHRRKTGQRLDIAWTKEMQAIVNKYPDCGGRYLLPILSQSDEGESDDERTRYRNVCNRINRNLKKVAGMIGLAGSLTTYCARHSWASIAKAQGVPTSVISDGMGHESERTTQIYLASLDTTIVDRANDEVIASING